MLFRPPPPPSVVDLPPAVDILNLAGLVVTMEERDGTPPERELREALETVPSVLRLRDAMAARDFFRAGAVVLLSVSMA